jgi:putative zinc finger/helix-turn-helix YgiT family protein
MKRAAKPRSERQRGDRPFPWPCPACLEGQVRPVVIPYTANIKHDGVLHSVHLPEFEVPRCQACGELVFTNHADEQISNALRARLRLLTPEQIRAARKALGLEQKELATRLGVAKETISRWETGALIQSRAMDNLLRLFFHLPEVRKALRGEDQDPSLGVPTMPSDPAAPPVLPGNRIARFYSASKVYGEARLQAEVRRVQVWGVLLPIGKR